MRWGKCLLGLALLASTHAHADTIYVASGTCVGQPTPCTTDLQAALDDTRYAQVEVLADQALTGDFLIDRTLTLVGRPGASVQAQSGHTYVLRIEGATGAAVQTLDLTGRLGVSQSSSVTLTTLNITAPLVAVAISASDSVAVFGGTFGAADRGMDVATSTNVSVSAGASFSADYGIVVSGSSVTIDASAVAGTIHALVVQEYPGAAAPRMEAINSQLTTGGVTTTWRWGRASTLYTHCTPVPSETLGDGGLLALLGFEPWPFP